MRVALISACGATNASEPDDIKNLRVELHAIADKCRVLAEKHATGKFFSSADVAADQPNQLLL